MQVQYGLPDLKTWIDVVTVYCESSTTDQVNQPIWALRKIIESMEQPHTLNNLRTLLAELEGMR